MDVDAVFDQAEKLTTHDAARLTGKHVNTIRQGIADGRILARKFGRDYQIPVVYGSDGAAYFLYRVSKGEE